MTGTLESLASGHPALTSGVFFRLKKKDFTLSLEAGLEKVRLDGLRFSAVWTFRDVRECEAPSP